MGTKWVSVRWMSFIVLSSPSRPPSCASPNLGEEVSMESAPGATGREGKAIAATPARPAPGYWTGHRDRPGHSAKAEGAGCRDVHGLGFRDDRLCGLLVAAAGASARVAHEQRHGRLALGRVLRRLRPRGPVPHRDNRPGRCPLYRHSGCGDLRSGSGRAGIPRNGILVRLAVACDRRCRSGRMLHAGPQGAHRPLAEGTAGARGGLLHGLLQRRDRGLLRARGWRS